MLLVGPRNAALEIPGRVIHRGFAICGLLPGKKFQTRQIMPNG
jgi:hypothetical protein